MIFRAIKSDNDWTFGTGKGSYLTGNAALMANVKTSLYFFLNDCFFAMNVGIDWWNLLGSMNPAARNGILLQTRETLRKCYGIVRITKIDAVTDPFTRKLVISYTVDTIYSSSVTGSVAIS